MSRAEPVDTHVVPACKTTHQLDIQGLIDELQVIQRLHGNLPVVLRDADTCWTFCLEAQHLAIGTSDNAGSATPRLEIGADYRAEFDTPSRIAALIVPGPRGE